MNTDKINDFLVNSGLYIVVPFSNDESSELGVVLCATHSTRTHYSHTVFHKFDSYCPSCQKSSVFDLCAERVHFYSDISGLRNVERQVTSYCARDTDHTIRYWLRSTNDGVMKIGQFPPIKDILSSNVSRYRKILKKDLIELQTAIQLHSHGVGIGSFVYLRRIFENLIYNAFEENKPAIEEGDSFFQMRMDEKIETVKAHIPSFINNNRGIYGILSKGVHELDESECLTFFPVLKESIEMILEEKINQIEEKEKASRLSKAINVISSKLNGANS